MNNAALGIIVFFLIINLVAFVMMFLDKVKAQQPGKERISEGMLFFMATMFGSIGVYAGMFAFRHKTRKWYFIIGIPMLIIQNSVFLYLAYRILAG
jgi:uncharacterized membrane protein YsdA (DUF1294 family)